MKNDILVALYSEDSYALNWMSLLVVRDWRTRVVLEASNYTEFSKAIKEEHQYLDVIVLDLDMISEFNRVADEINQYALKARQKPKVIALASTGNSAFFRAIEPNLIAGYLLKSEISMSLGWAISFASENDHVFTPNALDYAFKANFQPGKNKVIMRSRKYPGLTDRQSEIARLAIIFSIGRRDLADELKISDQWSYGVVSELYTQLGLGDILDESQEFRSILENDKVIKSHIDDILVDLGTSRKARDLETLAFHLLTMPVIE
jgi:DNA-binding NarL/FixJ family response regulator